MNGLCAENKLRDKDRRRQKEVTAGVQGGNDGQAQGTLGESNKNLSNFECILKVDLTRFTNGLNKEIKRNIETMDGGGKEQFGM